MDSENHESVAQEFEQLRELVGALLPSEGTACIGGALRLFRFNRSDFLENCLYSPSIWLAVQGMKTTTLGARRVAYAAGQCLVVNVDMPSIYHVTGDTDGGPFLAVSVDIARPLLAKLSLELPPLPSGGGADDEGVTVMDAPGDIVNCFLRLARLATVPEHLPFLAPSIIQEIHYRLLVGPAGPAMRRFGSKTTPGGQIALAVGWLRENFRRPLHVTALASLFNMGTSTFHRHFKAVTSLSPLQFHKRLRLYEAQRLMLAGSDVTGAALAVGYESPTQFNRDYKKMFGEPPHKDVVRRRAHV